MLDVGGREVAVSNPGKVYFPEAGITKLDVVRYYLAVAEGALRGAGGRPNVLVRYANGIHGEFFYQKRAPASRPPWVDVVTLRFPSGRTAEEVVPRDAAALAWMANLGCLELHPHPVRATDLEHPDELRVDLDPMPGIEWTADPGGGPGRARGAGRFRPRGLAEDFGLARRARQRADRAALVVHPGEARRPRPRPRGRAARPRPRHQQVVEGGEARRLPRLQPEREGPHGGERVLGTPEARRAGLRARDLGRALPVPAGGVHAAHDARPLRRDRRPARGHRLEPRLARGAPGARRPGRRKKATATRRGRRTMPSRPASRRASSPRAGGAAPRRAAAASPRSPSSRSGAPRRRRMRFSGSSAGRPAIPKRPPTSRPPTCSSTRCAGALPPGPASA